MKRPILLLTATLSLTAYAGEDSPEWQELVTPASSVEVGIGHVGNATPAAANKTGFDQSGAFLIGAFDLRGGAAYASAEALRWRFTGNQLGLDSRELQGEYGEQGKYRIRFGHDTVLRFLATDDYRTPFLGAGGTALTLPAGYVPSGTTTSLASRQQFFDIDAKRRRTNIDGSVWLSPHWEWRAALREDKQTGTRASGASLGAFGPGTSPFAIILPEPVETTTRRFETSLGYQEKHGHLELAYRGSFFNNANDSYNFQNPTNTTNTLPDNRMGSAPDNQAHQISLNGGYRLSPTTRFTASAAYGRLTQNDTFLPYSTAIASPALPRDSLDGLVVTQRAQMKLTSRPLKLLRLNASYNYDSRDNRTPVNEYNLPGVSAAKTGEVGGANYTVSNTPYSRRTRLGKIEAAYALWPGSDLNLTAQRENIERYCHGLPDCTEIGQSRENTLKLDWRQELAPGITGSLGISDASRRGDDYQRVAESVELAGMRKFFLADRQRAQVRASVSASVTDALTLGLGLDVNRDRYNRSPYGLQSADSHAANFDLGYAVSDELSMSFFAGRETFNSRLASSYAATAPGNVTDEIPGSQWQADMDDTVDSAGLTFKHKGLMAGRMELDGDLTFIRSRSPYQVVGGPSLPAAQTPEPLPTVKSRSVEARLNARYALDTNATLRLAYLYRRLASADLSMDLYSAATVARLLGTDETSPRYSTHLLGVSYLYSFR